jgi:hypothetical protein
MASHPAPISRSLASLVIFSSTLSTRRYGVPKRTEEWLKELNTRRKSPAGMPGAVQVRENCCTAASELMGHRTPTISSANYGNSCIKPIAIQRQLCASFRVKV